MMTAAVEADPFHTRLHDLSFDALNSEDSFRAEVRRLAEMIMHVMNIREDAFSVDWIVDEASLLSAHDTARLFDLADKHDARIILVGDVRQLGSIEAGAAFVVSPCCLWKAVAKTTSKGGRMPTTAPPSLNYPRSAWLSSFDITEEDYVTLVDADEPPAARASAMLGDGARLRFRRQVAHRHRALAQLPILLVDERELRRIKDEPKGLWLHRSRGH